MGKIAVVAMVSSWVVAISILVNCIVPDPYMDEIFHIPQAQQYCKGNFRSWDPMITTPPGLYIVSLAHVASLFPGLFSMKVGASFSDACSSSILRSSNGVLAVFCSFLVYNILNHLRPSLSDRKVTLRTVVLALYPLHWFFSFLYYTDVASLTAVLASYLMSLKKNYFLSSVVGALAVLIRQTNIIWVLFIACTGVLDYILTQQKDSAVLAESSPSQGKDAFSVWNQGVGTGSNLRKRRIGNQAATFSSSVHQMVASTKPSSDFSHEVREIISRLWQLKWELFATFWPYFIVMVAFITFVCWNGSIVLGAKEAHTVSPHFAQLMYFSLVSALFMTPVHFTIRQAAMLAQSFWKKNKLVNFFELCTALIVGFFSVHFFSIAHPYLVADNRHYPFYLWRKVIKFHWTMKYLLVPLYVYSWISIFNILAKSQRKTWVLVYFLATAATLIPAPLIEFRYYTIPFFFLILHSHVDDDRSWLLMGVLYVSINFFTMYMFLFRPFSWVHETGVQRFIW
ncbi:dol-P-Glc:Glc(2)Man(9)GlcNAc(2)-PP-Dol alpha-1,2-glucosyltransferase isoform X1 [Nicotiana tabacum]|uniref:Dol-P-Glc:Glc(2)Man(9)GlcNAc(2)-PP-Dol alpha-1,2-glucosyltransferase isoform X1 n=2 Tax=Nicotiana TaxID=4085 RepID=A0AC58S1F2_TOBAC|nr:PREDICTED: putative Dol-P-Glc:Glc(2)Man(9)GlcNAc(2)-PP-Dol alpha-1,2-glucosyltransferase isoform X1 [Nicotiana sylvestris]